jgi:hypothetical protein
MKRRKYSGKNYYNKGDEIMKKENPLDMTLGIMFHEAKSYRKKPIVVRAAQIHREFKVKTMEGTMTGKAGDYCIIGIKGEMYPCDKDIFEQAYEEVKERWYHRLMFWRRK